MLTKKEYDLYKKWVESDETKDSLEGDSSNEIKSIMIKANAYFVRVNFELSRIKNEIDKLSESLQQPVKDEEGMLINDGMKQGRAKTKAELMINETNILAGGVTRREIEYLCENLENTRVTAKSCLDNKRIERFGNSEE